MQTVDLKIAVLPFLLASHGHDIGGRNNIQDLDRIVWVQIEAFDVGDDGGTSVCGYAAREYVSTHGKDPELLYDS